MKIVKIDKKLVFFTVQSTKKLKILTKEKCERNISYDFRGRSEKYYKIRINKTKRGYGTFNRDSVRRAELRDKCLQIPIFGGNGKRVGRSYLDHHGGNRGTLYHICPKLVKRQNPGKVQLLLNPHREKDFDFFEDIMGKKTGKFRI